MPVVLSSEDLATQIKNDFLSRIGDAWELWSVEDRAVVDRVIEDAAALQVLAMLPPVTPESHQQLLTERNWLKTSLQNINVAIRSQVNAVIWQSVASVMQKALAFALAAI